MPRKSTTITIRMAPDVKDILALVASKEHRSVANMIEWMVLKYSENVGSDTNHVKWPSAPGKARKSS